MKKVLSTWEHYRKWAEILIFLLMLVTAISLRLTRYGDLRTSIGNSDTRGYLLASKPAFFSWQFFTTNRPFTLPLVFKLFEPPGDYTVSAQSQPAAGGSAPALPLQPDYVPVVLLQHSLSILAWSLLAWTVYYHLRTLPGKIFAALLVLGFGFVPQMAQWDWLLISESLSFSLLVLFIAFTVWVAVALLSAARTGDKVRWPWLAVWTVTLLLLVFTRDTNSYLLQLLIVVLLAALALIWLRSRRVMVSLVVLVIALVGINIFHDVTFRVSGRWIGPFYHNLQSNVFAYPDRMQFFEMRGMPPVEQDLTRVNELNAPFLEWTQANGLSTYTRFLLDYPLWAVQTAFDDMDEMFAENMQPYYGGFPRLYTWIAVGNLLHARSSVVVLVSFGLALSTLLLMLRFGSRQTWGLWAAAMLILLGGLFLYFIAYHGDSWGRVRHTLAGVMPLRLSIWLFAALLLDLAVWIGLRPAPET